MLALYSYVRSFYADRRGVTAVEYGIIAALIATALVAAVNGLGGNITTAFTNIGTHLSSGK